jgi:hypothetical protein
MTSLALAPATISYEPTAAAVDCGIRVSTAVAVLAVAAYVSYWHAYFSELARSAFCGIVVKPISADAFTTITSSDIHVTYLVCELQLLSVSTNGSDFAYWADAPAQPDGWFALYSGGISRTAPQLNDNYPETADITGDGSSILFTASQIGLGPVNYPGVYEWQLP